MTTRTNGAHIDAIWWGFQAALLAYPAQPAEPADISRRAKAAGRAPAMTLDDWHRGTALARECLVRCEAEFQPRRATSPFVHSHEGSLRAIAMRVALDDGADAHGGIPDEDLYPDDHEVLDLLREFAANVAETGDPDVTSDPAGDDLEQEVGDDEQGAVLARLRWEVIGGQRVLVSDPLAMLADEEDRP